MTRIASVILAVALAGCSTNYSFKRAEKPDGSHDVEQLIADLADEPQLSESVGVPLLFDWKFTQFQRETARVKPASSVARTLVVTGTEKHPSGYKLSETRDLGPFGIFWSTGKELYYDDSGEAYESLDYRSVLGDLWSRDETTVSTLEGQRIEVEHFLLFGLVPIHRSTSYPKGNDTAAKDRLGVRVAVSSPPEER